MSRKTRHLAVWSAVCCLASLCPAVRGDALSDVKKENAELRQRVDRLEEELKQIKALLTAPAAGAAPGDGQGKPAPGGTWLEARRQIEKDAHDRSRKGPAVWSSLDLQLYGYIKADASHDTARTSVGNFARWVETEQGDHNDDQFNMTANQTRLGLKITGPETPDMKSRGQVEIDFYGGGAENKPQPMLRHAYMELSWPDSQFSILAGQTSDVISPLVPSTLNYAVAWWAGNIGYRRPQIRLTRAFSLPGKTTLKLEGALARTIGHDSGFDPGDSGEDAGYPGFQGRTSVTFPLIGEKPTTIGLSGHLAGEEYDTDAFGHHEEFCSWSANLDITQPIQPWLTVKGEAFTGKNLDAYLGGIGQGIDEDTLTEIASCGGWLAAGLGPWGNWRFNVGAGVEAVDPSYVTADDARTLNGTIFGNVIYQFNKHASLGFELSHWYTEYKRQNDGDSLRFQTSFLYKF